MQEACKEVPRNPYEYKIKEIADQIPLKSRGNVPLSIPPGNVTTSGPNSNVSSGNESETESDSGAESGAEATAEELGLNPDVDSGSTNIAAGGDTGAEDEQITVEDQQARQSSRACMLTVVPGVHMVVSGLLMWVALVFRFLL